MLSFVGRIEALVETTAFDVIISNCVNHLSPEKQRVFDEAFRVLQPGGRLAVADMVATAPLPDDIKSDWLLTPVYGWRFAGHGSSAHARGVRFENIELCQRFVAGRSSANASWKRGRNFWFRHDRGCEAGPALT